MATPTAAIRARTYYHGTDNEARAKKILSDGYLLAPDVADLDRRYGRAYQRPVAGRVYLSPSLRYAVIYAIGGSFLGQALPDSRLKKGQFGYVFVVAGSALDDVEPDEDALGHLVWLSASLGSHGVWGDVDDHPELTAALQADPVLVRELQFWFQRHLTPNMYRLAREGEGIWQSKAGKRLLNKLPERLRVRVAELGSSIGAQTKVQWSEAWQLDKRRTSELKRDASNFFELAEQVS